MRTYAIKPTFFQHPLVFLGWTLFASWIDFTVTKSNLTASGARQSEMSANLAALTVVLLLDIGPSVVLECLQLRQQTMRRFAVVSIATLISAIMLLILGTRIGNAYMPEVTTSGFQLATEAASSPPVWAERLSTCCGIALLWMMPFCTSALIFVLSAARREYVLLHKHEQLEQDIASVDRFVERAELLAKETPYLFVEAQERLHDAASRVTTAAAAQKHAYRAEVGAASAYPRAKHVLYVLHPPTETPVFALPVHSMMPSPAAAEPIAADATSATRTAASTEAADAAAFPAFVSTEAADATAALPAFSPAEAADVTTVDAIAAFTEPNDEPDE